jgi:hypothetical protein
MSWFGFCDSQSQICETSSDRPVTVSAYTSPVRLDLYLPVEMSRTEVLGKVFACHSFIHMLHIMHTSYNIGFTVLAVPSLIFPSLVPRRYLCQVAVYGGIDDGYRSLLLLSGCLSIMGG